MAVGERQSDPRTAPSGGGRRVVVTGAGQDDRPDHHGQEGEQAPGLQGELPALAALPGQRRCERRTRGAADREHHGVEGHQAHHPGASVQLDPGGDQHVAERGPDQAQRGQRQERPEAGDGGPQQQPDHHQPEGEQQGAGQSQPAPGGHRDHAQQPEGEAGQGGEHPGGEPALAVEGDERLHHRAQRGRPGPQVQGDRADREHCQQPADAHGAPGSRGSATSRRVRLGIDGRRGSGRRDGVEGGVRRLGRRSGGFEAAGICRGAAGGGRGGHPSLLPLRCGGCHLVPPISPLPALSGHGAPGRRSGSEPGPEVHGPLRASELS